MDSTGQLKLLFQSGRKMTLPKGQVIQASDYRQDLIMIERGYVSRYLIADDGSLRIQSVYAPGYIFPLTLVFKTLYDINIYTGPETIYYNALTDIELYAIDQQTLIAAVHEQPNLYSDLLREAGRRLQSNIQWLENSALKTPLQRVAHQLFYFTEHFATRTAVGLQIQLPLTHQDLADILGLARETVSRNIVHLTGQHIIESSNKHQYTVTDLEKLKQIITDS